MPEFFVGHGEQIVTCVTINFFYQLKKKMPKSQKQTNVRMSLNGLLFKRYFSSPPYHTARIIMRSCWKTHTLTPAACLPLLACSIFVLQAPDGCGDLGKWDCQISEIS